MAIYTLFIYENVLFIMQTFSLLLSRVFACFSMSVHVCVCECVCLIAYKYLWGLSLP